jgi:hypothetical protein
MRYDSETLSARQSEYFSLKNFWVGDETVLINEGVL